MIKGVSRFAALFAAILAVGVLPAAEEVLYWMVDDNAKVYNHGTSSDITDFITVAPDDSDSWSAARIRVTGGDIQAGQDVFLDLYIPGYGLDVGGGEYGVEFSEIGGYWGAGVPDGNQSPSGDYSAGTPEYSFIVELGNIDSSDNWTTVAKSAATAYSSLGDYIHPTFSIDPSSLAAWTPVDFVATPEPSSGLLTLMGIAIVALRRRRMNG